MRLVDGERHREAITSRPMLLGGVARQTQHAGQRQLNVSLTHAKRADIRAKLTQASRFLQALITAAEQLAQPERWRRLLARIFEKYLEPEFRTF